MVGLFTFDGPLYKDKNGIYCNTTITNEMLERYFCVVDKLYLLIRTFSIEQSYEDAHMTKLDLGNCIEVIEVPNLNSPIQYFSRHRYYKEFKEIVSKCDMIFLRIPSVISDMVAKICKQIEKPYLVEVGGCSWDSYFNHNILGKLIAPMMFLNQKSTVKNAQFASYVTEKWLQNRYPAQCTQIAASNVYLRDFDEEIIHTRIMRCEKASYVPKKIGTIASIDVRYKGQEYVIHALHKLKILGYRLDYELVGAGVGNYLKALAIKLGVEDQVHFLGLKKHISPSEIIPHPFSSFPIIPNISTNLDLTRVSNKESCCLRFSIKILTLSSFSAIAFCSSISDKGIEIFLISFCVNF